MNSNRNKVTHTETADSGIEEKKYLSLITTIKGFEEFSLDEDGLIISSNLELINITGYEEHEVIGKHISIFYPVEDKRKAFEDLERAKVLGAINTTGLRLKKRGTTFWAKMKLEHTSERFSRRCFKVILRDSTHRLLSNLRVQSIQDEYFTLFNNPFIGAFKFNKSDYCMLRCNPKVLQITGYENSDHFRFNEIFRDPIQFNQFILLLEQDKRVEGFQFLIKNESAPRENWGLISARCFDREGFIEGILLDISENHNNQMIEVQRLHSELDNFTYHASHDLRSPLTTIMGLINLAKLEPAEKVHSSLILIENRVKHLDLVLKDLASITYNNNSKVECAAFDFKHEVDLLINENSNTSLDTILEIEIAQSQSYYTDPTRLRTIIRNLIANALTYQKPDSNQLSIVLKIKVEPTHVAIKIKDNGIGIEWILKNRIWDMFFRGTTQSTGTGLGLYIAKSMIEKLRGTISVESTPGEGTTFLMVIPNCICDSLV
ncbi:hypothetical protein WSM22_39060 [Cytophagales bacterium WSM2-2]|nr:hypothetical protein WSM22_39060 [Cytophagales bacterium WSM2-2]